MPDIVIEPLGEHPRGAFCCDVAIIQNFFRNNALKQHRAYQQRIFVACADGNSTPLGFYALTIMTFDLGMDDEADKKFARVEAIPTIYLSMIGRDKELGPRGLGGLMMEDAFRRCLEVREHVGAHALTLHAFNDKVKSIYESMGFKMFDSRESDNGDYPAMYIKLKTVAAALEAA